MTETQEKFSEREEIEILLPWYVTGRLDAAETARVAAYIERHPDVRSQLGLVREEQTATVAGNEEIRARLASAEKDRQRRATPRSRPPCRRSWRAGSCSRRRRRCVCPRRQPP